MSPAEILALPNYGACYKEVERDGSRYMIPYFPRMRARFIPEDEPVIVYDDAGVAWSVVDTDAGLMKKRA